MNTVNDTPKYTVHAPESYLPQHRHEERCFSTSYSGTSQKQKSVGQWVLQGRWKSAGCRVVVRMLLTLVFTGAL